MWVRIPPRPPEPGGSFRARAARAAAWTRPDGMGNRREGRGWIRRAPCYPPRVSLAETTQVLHAALDGEVDARGALLERLRPRIVLWVASRMSPALRAKVEPDDVAQEVLLAVHKGLDRFEHRDQGSFFGWLFRIAENRIRDQVDHFGAKKRQTPEPVSFSQTSPSMAARRREQVGRIVEAVEALPPDYREVIRLRRFQELECRQVAEIMNRSENAVRVLYCRALKALARSIKEEADGAD